MLGEGVGFTPEAQGTANESGGPLANSWQNDGSVLVTS